MNSIPQFFIEDKVIQQPQVWVEDKYMDQDKDEAELQLGQ
jgi:hypothetical protein